MRVTISSALMEEMFDHAASAAPHEACGIMLAADPANAEHITGLLPSPNVHPAPDTHFEIDPQILVDVLRQERAGGARVAGYYHSHPVGRARPSATDGALSPRDGRLWAIIGEGTAAFWRDGEDGFQKVSYLIDDR
ncbi:M67 family metallopeptidase [Qipengyuania atrilutea]|uniref:M67 family metallopeptidase n=1 Tax=Qipengyuania atrilutea TaxID=2744473 RepID=A0A850H5H4_9SPHN|nr:M67 family metallopeptidase [Actirhodobacter atriluteus]NVD45412.1 M67 family metallopeptidase [Actirhodobacter atriluteus]